MDTTVTALGVTRRAVLTHSPTLHAKQSRGFDQTLAKARTPAEPTCKPRLARGNTRRGRTAVAGRDRHDLQTPLGRPRSSPPPSPATTPADLRLTWRTDTRARNRLENALFGKRILFTNRDTGPPPTSSPPTAPNPKSKSGFRQLKDPHVVSFSPMHHWTDPKIRVHVFYCVLALTIAHLMRRQADHAGLHLSVRELLATLAGIGETVLLYHDGGKGRPRARRMITDMTPTQQHLADLFDIHRYAPTR